MIVLLTLSWKFANQPSFKMHNNSSWRLTTEDWCPTVQSVMRSSTVTCAILRARWYVFRYKVTPHCAAARRCSRKCRFLVAFFLLLLDNSAVRPVHLAERPPASVVCSAVCIIIITGRYTQLPDTGRAWVSLKIVEDEVLIFNWVHFPIDHPADSSRNWCLQETKPRKKKKLQLCSGPYRVSAYSSTVRIGLARPRACPNIATSLSDKPYLPFPPMPSWTPLVMIMMKATIKKINHPIHNCAHSRWWSSV